MDGSHAGADDRKTLRDPESNFCTYQFNAHNNQKHPFTFLQNMSSRTPSQFLYIPAMHRVQKDEDEQHNIQVPGSFNIFRILRWDTKKCFFSHNNSFPSVILYIMYIWERHQSPKKISKSCRCKGERRNIELYESLREFWIYPGITSEPANFGEILTQEASKEVVSILAKHEALSETDITKLRISFSISFKNVIVFFFYHMHNINA